MDRISFYDQISKNKRNSIILMILIFMIFIALGYVISLATNPGYFFIIMIFTIIFSSFYLIIGFYNSDKIALASVNAKPASKEKYPQYHNIVEGLCLASGMPKPKLYIMKNQQINAFASGRDPQHAVICVTTGALEKLNKQELEGVLGHELSHIASYDIRFMTLTAVLVGMIAIISEIFLRSLFFSSLSGDRNRDNSSIIFLLIGIILAIIAPIVTMLVQLAISRKREYSADASAVKFIRSPTGLIKALEKIKNDSIPNKQERISKTMSPLFISDPFRKKVSGLLQTHPPLEKRIEILKKM